MEHKALVAKRLREQRALRSQRAFSARVRAPQQTIAKYEGGDIPENWLFLARLHDEEDVDLNALLTRKES